ncbi:MAG: hypothetical protein NPIRA02_29530 [Nitrospirales bacterium]|nr:MAG: hypothetical protein NPIRA02_29530 [Nitrospirales bacterium]
MEYAEYEIGDKHFYQTKLLLFQGVRLSELIEHRDQEDLTASSLIKVLGSKMPLFLDIILIPKGMSREEFVQKKGTPGLLDHAEHFNQSCELEQVIEVVNDFFECNRAAKDRFLALLLKITTEETENPTDHS